MGDQVKVADIETIARFRAALVQAAETFGLALEEAEGDIERTVVWLQTERPDTWRRRIRKAQDEVVACKGALYRKQEIKATPEARPSVVDERKALERAQRRLEHAEEKLRATKRWANELPRQMAIFKGALSTMHVLLDRDMPRMNAMMRRMEEHLDDYLRGGDERDRLIEILGTQGSMARGGEDADAGPPGATGGSAAAEDAP
ncbi:MAG: hypothetical protein ACKOEL_07525 [Planctomycetota bacterium]|jgi:hypothetical protein